MSKGLEVLMPYSSVKENIAHVLREFDFIEEFSVVGEGVGKSLSVQLAYDESGEPRIKVVKRISKPSLRKYIKAKDIQYIRGGFGLSIISTSEGIMSGQAAKKKGLGGEVIAHLW